MNVRQAVEYGIDHNLNVMLIGKHGVGKTSIIKAVVEERNLKWLYFSASTMDPWVDFIGIPEKSEGILSNGERASYLEMVMPKNIREGDVEVLVFDELNRADSAVRNALMQLIQFKAINGYHFKNLRCVIVAINPDDDEDMSYDVEKLDPAQIDRFQLQVDVPYEPDRAYFADRYKETGLAAVDWWHAQHDKVKNIVSPRRLDYAVDMFIRGGDLRAVLRGKEINVTEFINSIRNVNLMNELEELRNRPEKEIKAYFLADNNRIRNAIKVFKQNTRIANVLMPMLPEEEVLRIIQSDRSSLTNLIARSVTSYRHIWDAVKSNPGVYSSRVENAINTASRASSDIFKTSQHQNDKWIVNFPVYGSYEITSDDNNVTHTISRMENGKNRPIGRIDHVPFFLTGGVTSITGPIFRGDVVHRLRKRRATTWPSSDLLKSHVSNKPHILIVGDRAPSQKKIDVVRNSQNGHLMSNAEFLRLFGDV